MYNCIIPSKGLLSLHALAQRHSASHSFTLVISHVRTCNQCQMQLQSSYVFYWLHLLNEWTAPSSPPAADDSFLLDPIWQSFGHSLLPLSLLIPQFQTPGWIRFGRRDAGGEWEQRCRPPGQAEEKIPQPVYPQDQQHWAGALRPAERHAGRTGQLPDHSENYVDKSRKHIEFSDHVKNWIHNSSIGPS